jgi:hypothetical protein
MSRSCGERQTKVASQGVVWNARWQSLGRKAGGDQRIQARFLTLFNPPVRMRRVAVTLLNRQYR